MRKIKILEAVGTLGVGGNELFVMNFYRHIDKSKFQIDFITFSDNLYFKDEIEKSGSKVYVSPLIKRNNKWIKLFHDMRFIYFILKKNNYDIIHCHSCSFVGLFRGVLPALLIKDIKIITHSHNTGKATGNILDKILRFLLKILLSNIIDIGMACSDLAGKSKYTKAFIHSNKYKLINNAIETEKYLFNKNYRNEVRKQLGINENVIVIGNVGRLAMQKNQTFLINILFNLIKQKKNVYLLIAGGGILEKTLEDKVVKLGLNEFVYFAGETDDVYKYYSAMDVFVMPSLYEGLPFTAIEAQVNGLKCVFADTITKMADISGNNIYISLNSPISNWSNLVLEQGLSRNSLDSVKKVCMKYNIANESKRLEKIYSSCV